MHDFRRWIALCEAKKPTVYLRLGDIPANERSRIGRSPNWIKALHRNSDHEIGVSVFDVQWDERRQRWAIQDASASLDELFAAKRPAYLVTGREVGTGIDGEPLLRSVKIVEPVPYHKLYVPGWGNNPLPEEYLDLEDSE